MKKLLFAMTTVLMALAACSTQGTDENQEATAANQDNGQAAIENIMTRTSIRQYKDQPVEQEKIDIMLKAAMAAPTAVNLQPWHFIVITDKKTIGLLSGKQPTNAPLLIAMCGDTDKTTMPDGKMKLPDFWVQDVSAATENLLLAAHALGLGAVWTAVYPAMERVAEVANVLNCPQNIVPVAVVRVGYPDEAPEPKNKFKEENISYNKFGGKLEK
ncbi:MAG: nitroreductase family protein [Bacteroidales bacterium]|jgi:nitroreductase|nr:nitroreductase family protein [Bacteroidales bacterium]